MKMEKKTMGSFIAALRKAKGMTQQDVADRLNVSNKTVSKWERDEGYPEITMLPVIAELFEVTTDELLRGERIFRNGNNTEPVKDVKAEKHTKYIFERAITKFTNLSVVSVATGVTALFIAYLADYIIVSIDKRWIPIVLTLLLTPASVIVQVIAFNSLKPSLNAEDITEESFTYKGKKKAALYLSLTVLLAITNLVGIITYMGDEFVAFLMLIPGLLLGLIIAFVIYCLVCKSLGIDGKTEHSAVYIFHRKKHVKATAITVCVICLFSAVFPFAGTLIDYAVSESAYCFTEGIGCQYNSAKEAENEYYKLKGYFEGKNELYSYLDEDREMLTMTVYPVSIVFDETKEGIYNVVSATSSMTAMIQDTLDGDYYRQLEFNSIEELEEYKEKYVWDEYESFSLDILERDIRFDDDTLTVNWKQSGPRFYQTFDIMPIYILGGSVVSLAVIGISAILWNGKKKRIV